MKQEEGESEVGKWLKGIFGIAFLNPEEVQDCFVEDFMAVAPQDKCCTEFADYLTENYKTDESMFPPNLWAKCHQIQNVQLMNQNLSMRTIMNSFTIVIREFTLFLKL